jgi:hypothetical protein
MHTKAATVTFVILLVCFGVALPAVHAQGTCSLQTFAGTYAMYEKGSSLTIDLNSPGVLSPADGSPATPPAWDAPGIVPFVNIAEVTFTPDGIGDGFFWMWAGSISASLEPIPVHVTVNEMNEDCTGRFSYTLPNGAYIEERLIVFDNGRQFRSVPKSGGIPTLAWIGTGHRIGKGSAPVNFCGPQTAHGSYLMTCENIMRSAVYQTKAVADSFLLRMDVSMDGDYTGLLYEKYGKQSIDGLPVAGTVAVNPDCSFAATLDVNPNDEGAIEERGVFFNEGKEFYGMGILNPSRPADDQGIRYSFCQGTRIGQ